MIQPLLPGRQPPPSVSRHTGTPHIIPSEHLPLRQLLLQCSELTLPEGHQLLLTRERNFASPGDLAPGRTLPQVTHSHLKGQEGQILENSLWEQISVAFRLPEPSIGRPIFVSQGHLPNRSSFSSPKRMVRTTSKPFEGASSDHLSKGQQKAIKKYQESKELRVFPCWSHKSALQGAWCATSFFNSAFCCRAAMISLARTALRFTSTSG